MGARKRYFYFLFLYAISKKEKKKKKKGDYFAKVGLGEGYWPKYLFHFVFLFFILGHDRSRSREPSCSTHTGQEQPLILETLGHGGPPPLALVNWRHAWNYGYFKAQLLFNTVYIVLCTFVSSKGGTCRFFDSSSSIWHITSLETTKIVLVRVVHYYEILSIFQCWWQSLCYTWPLSSIW